MGHRRFLVKKEFIRGDQAILRDNEEIRHLWQVRRLKPGDQVILFNGEGHEYEAIIRQIKPDEVVFQIQPIASISSKESPLKIILGIGVLKGTKFDWLIQKITELGVTEIVPFYGRRSVPNWEGAKIFSKKNRWEKIALAASKQCQRTKIPVIHPPCSFKEALQKISGEVGKIFFWEKESKRSLAQITLTSSSAIYALVGPEGGFSEEETAQAQEAGFEPVHLGPRILRSETAGIVVVGLLQFLFGDLNSK
ncbi:MAG: 16S rRNA (uracil(1498)-N(3))-methyltransferase [Thermodesulfobacteriota bacterium]